VDPQRAFALLIMNGRPFWLMDFKELRSAHLEGLNVDLARIPLAQVRRFFLPPLLLWIDAVVDILLQAIHLGAGSF
jgi:hypothetical protein